MKVITIGNDRNIFKEGSFVRERVKLYGRFCSGYNAIILNLSAQKKELLVIAPNIKIFPTNSKSKLGYFFDALKIIKKILTENDGNEYVLSAQDPFEMGFLAYVVHKLFKIPFQTQVHIDFFSPFYRAESLKNRFHYYLAKFVLRRSSRIRAVSQKIKNFLVENFKIDSEKIDVLPVYTDVGFYGSYSPKFDLHKKYQFKFIIFTAARFVKQKNIPLAISAFEKISESHKDTALVIVGSGPEEKKIKKLAEENGRIFFESWSDDLASFYKTADIFVLPSNYEGWAMTVVEACACGLPVVMTDVGCAEEFLENGRNGIVVPVGGEDEMAKSLADLLENDGMRKKIGEEALKKAESLPIKESWAKNIMASLEKCVDSASK